MSVQHTQKGYLHPLPEVNDVAWTQRSDLPSGLECWLWGAGVFLLTAPFAFQLVGIDPTQQVQLDLSSVRRTDASNWLLYAIRMMVAVGAVTAVLPFWRMVIGRIPRLGVVLAFLGWTILSLLWTDSVTSSINGVLGLIPLLVTGYCMALRLPPHLFARSYIYAGFFVLMFSVLYVIALPKFGMHQANDAIQAVHAGSWRGVYGHKNVFGTVCAMAATMTILASPNILPSRLFKLLLVGALILACIMSRSATAIAILFIAPAVSVLSLRLSAAQQALLVLVAVPLAFGVYAILGTIFALLGRDMTFTGRTTIWAYVPDAVAQRPMLGFGYASTTYGDFILKIYRAMGVTNPHNGFLDILLSLGIVGLCIFVACFISTWIAAKRLYASDVAAGDAALVLYSVLITWAISMLSEASDKPLGPLAALGFCAFGLLAYRQRQSPDPMRR